MSATSSHKKALFVEHIWDKKINNYLRPHCIHFLWSKFGKKAHSEETRWKSKTSYTFFNTYYRANLRNISKQTVVLTFSIIRIDSYFYKKWVLVKLILFGGVHNAQNWKFFILYFAPKGFNWSRYQKTKLMRRQFGILVSWQGQLLRWKLTAKDTQESFFFMCGGFV